MFSKILQSLFTKGVVAIINLCILIISSKYLGVRSRGEISIFILNITIIQAINEVYTGYSLIHFIPKFDLKRVVAGGIMYTLIFCSLSNAIVVFIHKQVPGFEWLGYLCSLLVILNTFHCIIILGYEKLTMFNLLAFLQPFLLLCGIMFYVYVLKKFTFESYIFPLLFSFGIAIVPSAAIVLSLLFKKSDQKRETYKIGPIVFNGFVFQANALMFVFCNRYSYYLLADTAKVGLYASASALTESVLIITNGIAPVLIARAANSNNRATTAHLALSLSKLSFLFSCLAMFIVLIIPESVYVRILGNGFIGIKHLMLLYAPGVLLVSFFATICNYLSAIGNQIQVLYSYLAGFLIALVLAPVLINFFGIVGAPYTAAISYLAIAIATSVIFRRVNKMSFADFFSFKGAYQQVKRIVLSKGRDGLT